MTREEAIVQIYGLKKYCEDMADSDESGSYVFELDVQALDLALTAIRPISRERVEKVWGGEWNNINPAVLKPGVSWVCRCAKCGCPQDYKHNFCPNCGAAQTAEAVEMVMERLEALHETV